MIVLSLTSVILVAVLIWRETKEEEKLKLTSGNLLKSYSSNFRTDKQQNLFAKQYLEGFNNRTVISEKVPALNGTCQFSCFQKSPARRRKRVAESGVYHGCCVSSVIFTSPTTKLDAFGLNRTLVQFTGARQYFPSHLCQSVAGCRGCTCSRENALHTAVVYKRTISVDDAEFIEDTEVDFFFFPGCCKCINN